MVLLLLKDSRNIYNILNHVVLNTFNWSIWFLFIYNILIRHTFKKSVSTYNYKKNVLNNLIKVVMIAVMIIQPEPKTKQPNIVSYADGESGERTTCKHLPNNKSIL